MAVKVGMDLRCLPPDGGPGAGVSHAARELAMRLVKDHSFEWIAYVPQDVSWSACPYVLLDSRTGSALRKGLRQKKCDMLLVPSGSVAPFLGVPALPWVHDLIIFEHPEWFPQSWLQRLITKTLFLWGLRKAPAIFAVSQYTKEKILTKIRKNPEKIIVTYEGGDSELAAIGERIETKKNFARERCAEKYGFKNRFILTIGTLEPRKNFAMLVRAWNVYREQFANSASPATPERSDGGQEKRIAKSEPFDLVLVGNAGWKYQEVIDQIKSLNHEDKYHLHHISEAGDNSKRNLLLAADAVCVPSLDEGFGLVALEAQQAGSRVISSNAGALPEVVGRNGVLLDPADEQAWTKALLEFSDGIQYHKINPEFFWEKAAEKVVAGLRKYGLPKIKRR